MSSTHQADGVVRRRESSMTQPPCGSIDPRLRSSATPPEDDLISSDNLHGTSCSHRASSPEFDYDAYKAHRDPRKACEANKRWAKTAKGQVVAQTINENRKHMRALERTLREAEKKLMAAEASGCSFKVMDRVRDEVQIARSARDEELLNRQHRRGKKRVHGTPAEERERSLAMAKARYQRQKAKRAAARSQEGEGQACQARQ